jgi:CHAD domain-containing protein
MTNSPSIESQESATGSEPSQPLASRALGTHLGAMIDGRLHKLSRTLKAAYAERSVDAVHDLRVVSRRLRAFGVTFEDVLQSKRRKRLQHSLRRVAKAVSSLRDRDVQIALIAERAEHPSSELERAGADYLLELFEAQRERSASKAKKRLRRLDAEAVSRHVRRAARDVLEQFLPSAGQRVYAHALLDRLVREAAVQAPRELDNERADELHRLRIDIKELRYALELFEPLFGEHFGPLHERATELQDALGKHRDLFVLCEALSAERLALSERGRQGLADSVAAVEAALTAQRRAVFERFREQGFDPKWWHQKLALAFRDT